MPRVMRTSSEFELDTPRNRLELDWRRQYEACIAARADYQWLAAQGACATLLDAALERLDRAEAVKARLMARIDGLEARAFGVD